MAQSTPATKTITRVNGRFLRDLAHAGFIWLDQNHQHVNELNVFPVPDGDTGINMLLTMRSAYNKVKSVESDRVDDVAAALSQGALMGARGNSGVILSQIWRGFASALEGKDSFNAAGFAAGMTSAAETAYKGVMTPVEGTILTVIREAAEEAQIAVASSDDLCDVFAQVIRRSKQSLDNTPNLLPVLKEAGVVDSGGMGLLYVFEGMMKFAKGELDLSAAAASGTQAVSANTPAQALIAPEEGIENPYDVQYLLMGNDLDVLKVRADIDAMGDSTVVVGDEKLIKVHIHVKDPGVPLSYGISLGHITDVVVENMQEQMEDIIAAGTSAPSQPDVPAVTIEPGQIGIVAVAPSTGFANLFRSMGVANVVDGGQTNNPSTEELFEAIQDVPTDKVILLPNNKNIILAAEAARDLSTKEVIVLPTRTVPQGLSAMIANNPDGELQKTADAMKSAADSIQSAEITTAVRTVSLDGVDVTEGDIIGLINGKLRSSGPDIPLVMESILRQIGMDDMELVSLYHGEDVTAADAQAMGNKIEELHEDVEVEIFSTGQPHYFYVIGAE